MSLRVTVCRHRHFVHLHLGKIQTQCEPGYLQMSSDRSDPILITTHFSLAPYLGDVYRYRSYLNTKCKWGLNISNKSSTSGRECGLYFNKSSGISKFVKYF